MDVSEAGRKVYLTITMPDISYVVSLVSQFRHAPRTDHLAAVHQILRYLKGSPDQGIIYKSYGHARATTFTVSNRVGSFLDRKSTTGYCMLLSGNPISWKS